MYVAVFFGPYVLFCFCIYIHVHVLLALLLTHSTCISLIRLHHYDLSQIYHSEAYSTVCATA